MSKQLFIVYNIASTMEKNSYGRKGDANRLAAKLNAEGRNPRSARIEKLKGYVKQYEELAASAELPTTKGTYLKILSDNAKELAEQQALFAVWGDAEYAVAELMEYKNEVVYWEQQTNMMSKKLFWERSNTPYYCSPSSETYWSM